MNSGKVFLGVLAGLAAGAVLGILFAPEKGSKTRKLITDKSDEYADEVKEKFNNLFEKISEQYESVQHQIKDVASNGKSKYDDMKKEAKNVTS